LLGNNSESKPVYRMLLTTDQLAKIKSESFILSVEEPSSNGSGTPLFPSMMNSRWSDKNYGPLKIPAKGMSIVVNDSTLNIYVEIITKYEGHDKVSIQTGQLVIDGMNAETYEFQQDYYFMMGDNRDNSLDSRFWGFVPEDHILGKPLFIWLSIDANGDLLHKVRWDRIFTSIK
jgi:signal peptidase I